MQDLPIILMPLYATYIKVEYVNISKNWTYIITSLTLPLIKICTKPGEDEKGWQKGHLLPNFYNHFIGLLFLSIQIS